MSANVFSIEFQVRRHEPAPVSQLGKFLVTLEGDMGGVPPSHIPGVLEHINALFAWQLGEDHRFKIAMHIWEKSRASQYTDRAVDSVQTWVVVPSGTQSAASLYLVREAVEALQVYALKYMRSFV